MPKSDLQKRIDELIKQHAGLRPAAKELGIDPSYLARMRDGVVQCRSPRTLKKLGLAHVERFARIGG